LATFSLWREECKRAFRDLEGEDLTPARLGAAVAVGLFIGSQPVFGLHLVLVLFVCLKLRLHAVLSYVAANISNPFLAPALLTAEVQVGGRVRTGHWPRLDREIQAGYGAFVDFAGHLIVGAPIVGVGLSVAGFVCTWSFVSILRIVRPATSQRPPYRLPPEAPFWLQATERVASRYASPESTSAAEKSQFHYVRIKLAVDPIARLIANVEGERDHVLGDVLDIGTGRGQLPILLLELGRATHAHGVDWDQAKIMHARRAADARPEGASQTSATFEAEDARTFTAASADTVLLIDLLHYFSIDEQNAILDRAADHVKPGGRLLVREADTERGWRSWATLLEEKIFTAVRFNRGERVRFRPAREIAARLVTRGFSCDIVPAWGSTPFSNVLVVARLPIETKENIAAT
jgi:2-polyprenyl-3-methyl-5-hydroxy-6-metoxy-1,4-benzoquinol methylase